MVSEHATPWLRSCWYVSLYFLSHITHVLFRDVDTLLGRVLATIYMGGVDIARNLRLQHRWWW
jgi:hypothetical protein